MQCKHKEKIEVEEGSLLHIKCAASGCSHIFQSFETISRGDGTIIKKPVRLPIPEEDDITFPGEKPYTSKIKTVSETRAAKKSGKPINAQDLANIASDSRDKLIDDQIATLRAHALSECQEAAIQGQTEKDVLVRTDGNTVMLGKTVAGAISELKQLGYKVTKVPAPQEGGIWIKISWNMKKKVSPKKKKRGRPKKDNPTPSG